MTDKEGYDDSRFTDLHRRGCEWYEETGKTQPSICAAQSVQEACPIACGLFPSCFVTKIEKPKVYTLFKKVQKITPRAAEGTLCMQDGLDLVAQCRMHQPVTSESRFWGYESFSEYASQLARDAVAPILNVTDCELVARVSVLQPTI